MTGPPGPGHVTTGLGSLDMRQRNRYLARRGAGGVNSGSGQAARQAGPVTLARRARKAPAPSHGATGGAGDTAQRTR